jgi:hypothetical protein
MTRIESSKGPSSYENWKTYLGGKEEIYASEFPLYSDTRVTGEETTNFKPYQFFNPWAHDEPPGTFRPTIYLRTSFRLDFEIPDIWHTDTERYHGGTIVDELAGLASLALGVRLRAGKECRFFHWAWTLQILVNSH